MPRRPSLVTLVAAQARAATGLAVALEPPLAGAAARRLLGAPREEECELAGVPASVFLPSRGPGPWPALVLFPGVTREGRRHAAFVALGRALGAAGVLAAVPEPDGLARGELTGATAAQAAAAATAVAERADASAGRITLAGVSGGATLALCAAAHPALRMRVNGVLAMAPVCDLGEALRFVTTGFRRDAGGLVPFRTRGFFELVSARSVFAALAPGRDRDVVLEHLRTLPDYGDEPLAAIRSGALTPAALDVAATLALFANLDPERFDQLVEALPAEARDSLEALSAVRIAPLLGARVELVVARRDKYLPLVDALAFASACPNVRLTVLDSLEHVVPRVSFGDVRDLARLNGALVRTLAASYSR